MGNPSRCLLVLLLCLPVRAFAPAAYPIVGMMIEPLVSGDAQRLTEQLLAVPVQKPGTAALAATTDAMPSAGLWLGWLAQQPGADATVWDVRLLLAAGDGPQSACSPRHAADSIARQRRRYPHNMLNTLNAALVTLQQLDASLVERARALRVVFATVVALHQPLRVFDPEAPRTSSGVPLAVVDGIDVPILGTRSATMPAGTVRNVWETGAGLFPQWPAISWNKGAPQLPKGWRASAQAQAVVVRQRAKADTWIDIGTPERWAHESWMVGCTWAHDNDITWSRNASGVLVATFADTAAAIDAVQLQSARQLLRASRRLAALLNMLADPYVHPTLTKYVADLQATGVEKLALE